MLGLLLGADLVDVREVEAALAQFGDRYLSRVYTPEEIAYAKESPAEMARRLGARFAAKEATIKALRASDAGVGLRSIEITRAGDGACEVRLSGEALCAARRAGAASLAVTLSHQGNHALAVVVGQRSRAAPSRLRWRSQKGDHRG
jgi:holo-[acyl-carrier protein] synthase